jgi:coproporphyrinogen III oxidase-like Fe-S oxidoreductase
MTGTVTRMIRSYLTGINTQYRLTAAQSPVLNDIEKTGLYLHIPFCKSLCPYCPYNKIVYDEKLIQPYLEAVLSEIDMYYRILGPMTVSSIYVGGGTPTLLVDELGIMLEKIGNCFNVAGDICIETSPADINDEVIAKLKSFNVGLISLGVQSFNDKYLRFIGRSYSSKILAPSIEKLLQADFKSVNADMLFAIPGQNPDELLDDLHRVVRLGLKQVTIYPLFTFPYSGVREYRRLKRVKTPNLLQRHRQYKLITRFFRNQGFNRVSVWSYKKTNIPRYSSATRDGYIGFGAGAGSYVPKGFYINTFSVSEYIRKCLSEEFPTALYMNFSDLMHKYFWLYWRLYDTRVTKEQLNRKFGVDDRRLRRLLCMLRLLGFSRDNNGTLELSDRGAFWVHLLQNHFILSYINRVWGAAKNRSWPQEIVL